MRARDEGWGQRVDEMSSTAGIRMGEVEEIEDGQALQGDERHVCTVVCCTWSTVVLVF